MDKVRVLRIIEYVGDRARVEEAVAKAIHGELDVGAKYNKGSLVIRAATIGTYPEILESNDAPRSSPAE